MAVLGLGKVSKKPVTSKKGKKKSAKVITDTKTNDDAAAVDSNDTQADEAKALLEQMNAKADADVCPFC